LLLLWQLLRCPLLLWQRLQCQLQLVLLLLLLASDSVRSLYQQQHQQHWQQLGRGKVLLKVQQT
jgi:hypothetical protein